MARNNNLTDFLKDVADAIREKTNAGGLINPQDFPERIAAIETGGSGEQPEGTHTVRFIDVDGTILKTQYVADGGTATPPANPSREKCTFVKWSDPYTNITNDTNVFALYKSVDGNTWYRVKAKAGQHLNLAIKCQTTSPVIIDWGDGSTDSATSQNSYSSYQHIYSVSFDGWVKVSSAGAFIPSSIDEGNPVVTEIIVGDVVNTIGSLAYKMTNLTACVIPATVKYQEGSPFRWCTSLVSIALPDGLTKLEANIPFAMLGLLFARVPSTMKNLSNTFLSYCYALQSVTIPSGVTSIGSNAFQYCYALQSVTIPSGVTSIGSSAFQGCFALQSVTIPSGVTSIGSNAFQGCSGLITYIMEEAVPPSLGSDVFADCSALAGIYVPDASVEAYKTATNWAAKADIIKPLSEFVE